MNQVFEGNYLFKGGMTANNHLRSVYIKSAKFSDGAGLERAGMRLVLSGETGEVAFLERGRRGEERWSSAREGEPSRCC